MQRMCQRNFVGGDAAIPKGSSHDARRCRPTDPKLVREWQPRPFRVRRAFPGLSIMMNLHERKAREIAAALKEWIRQGRLLLGEPQFTLPSV